MDPWLWSHGLTLRRSW